MGSLILPLVGPIYCDTQIFIYSVEKHPVYAPLLWPVWESVAKGDLEVVTSELTLMETMVVPLKQGNTSLEDAYEKFFGLPGIRLFPITASILRDAARLRAKFSRFRTPDALQVATAISCHCSIFLTNDIALHHVTDLPVLILDDSIAI
jgi:predicted nucleic acid-binding protein